MQEIWKTVYYKGVATNKLISNTGRMITEDGIEMTLSDNGAGYLSYQVANFKGDDGKWKNYREYAHRLVAKYFLPNPFNLPQVNHKDCDKSNNHVDNLEWISGRANINHAHASGRMAKRTENASIVILTRDQVVECYTRVKMGEGVAVVARSMGKSRTTISSIINKRSRVDITNKIDEELAQLKKAT